MRESMLTRGRVSLRDPWILFPERFWPDAKANGKYYH